MLWRQFFNVPGRLDALSFDYAFNRCIIWLMSRNKSQYSNSSEWREVAMQRSSGIVDDEINQRMAVADAHNRQHGISDADTLADQQLYVQGKMGLEEYQRYLLFKHSNPTSAELAPHA